MIGQLAWPGSLPYLCLAADSLVVVAVKLAEVVQKGEVVGRKGSGEERKVYLMTESTICNC